ncbi:hypothetical protein B005_5282 [Nocardiopsis alba ATCC BAA-2165]|uniref:Uncharacterized protein n=1 Tax=Nocardiopsis alba (strain ATCC BAA-2165 / BE74) TaxID=1205910 RepID=J7L5Q8_NOCAA|nr:hypothetical protein B005_5282 [Nocardiopsis alba ATCC BAA-2165]
MCPRVREHGRAKPWRTQGLRLGGRSRGNVVHVTRSLGESYTR